MFGKKKMPKGKKLNIDYSVKEINAEDDNVYSSDGVNNSNSAVQAPQRQDLFVEETIPESMTKEGDEEQKTVASIEEKVKAEVSTEPVKTTENEFQSKINLSEVKFNEEQRIKADFITKLNEDCEQDAQRANNTINGLIQTITEQSKSRYAGSKDEKAAARTLRDTMESKLGVPARMEPFDVAPLAGRQGTSIYGIIYAVFILLAIAWPKFGIIGIPILTIIMICQLYLNLEIFDKVFPQKTSYNVVAVMEKSRESVNKTLVLTANYDCDYGRTEVLKWLSLEDNNPRFRRFTYWFVLAGMVLLTIMSFIRAFANLSNAAHTIMALFNLIISGIAAAYMITYQSYRRSTAKKKKSGLSASGVALAVCEHIAHNPTEVPEDTRIVIVDTGALYAGEKGANAFIKAHLKRDDLLVNPVVLNIDNMINGDFRVITADAERKVSFDSKYSEMVFNSMQTDGLNPEKVIINHEICNGIPFAKAGISACSIGKKAFSGERKGNNKTDYTTEYQAVLHVVKELMAKQTD